MTDFYTNIVKSGNSIKFRGYSKNGKRLTFSEKFIPSLYFPLLDETQTPDAYSYKGNPLYKKTYSNIKEATQALNTYQGVCGAEVYGADNFVTDFISSKYPNDIEFDLSLIKILTFDIEVVCQDGFPNADEALHPIVSIAMHNSFDGNYYVLGMKEGDTYKRKETELEIDPKKIIYIHCDDEETLLSKFVEIWKAIDPDVITGWYIKGFDIPYIINRMERISENSSQLLSPFGWVHKKKYTERTFYGTRFISSYNITGVSMLDYMDVFKKLGYVYGPQENYKLDTIANTILGERKLDYGEYGNLTNLYENNFQKYIDYNIRDVNLVVRMEEVSNMISLGITMAYMAGSTFESCIGTVEIWHSMIFRRLKKNNIYPPALKPENFKESFGGGYVKEPNPIYYDWICSFDLASLYPNLIIQFNMSPDTIAGMKNDVSIEKYLDGSFKVGEEDKEYSIAANGALFSKEKQGFLPEILEEIYSLRKDIQKQVKELKKNDGDKKEIGRLNNMQMAIKILMNSVYGAMSNIYFIYYDLRIAEGTTLSGRLAIKWVEKYINEYLNEYFNTREKDYIIAIDTDSVYINLGELRKQNKELSKEEFIDFIDNFCETKIQKIINSAYKKYAEVTNSFKERMVMDREVIAENGLWTAKKRYILNLVDNDGFRYPLNDPKLKIVGVEAIKSSTPFFIRNKMKNIFKTFLSSSEKEVLNEIDDFKKYFREKTVEEISFPKTVNNLEKYYDDEKIYKKGTPINVRGSLLYNYYLEKNDLTSKYRKIVSGEKIKFIYLKMPNMIGENVIAFPDILPTEFGLHEFIDYDTQFEKVFKNPLKPIFKAMGWRDGEFMSLESLFNE